MPGVLVLALLLASASPERDAASAELEAVAVRIEQLKARHAAGEAGVVAELHRLLVRATELAWTIDRIDHGDQAVPHPPPRHAAPTSDELRERADAARDEADRIRSALEKIEVTLTDLQAGARAPQTRLAGTTPAPQPADPSLRMATLEAQRARLERSLAAALSEAERLEAQARLLDSMK